MPNHPLAEVFGFPPDNLTADADRHRRDRLCPFGNAVPNCTKTSIENPLGVCSVHGANGEAVITCPVRFQEGWRIASDAARFFFPPGAAWTSLTKVRSRENADSSNIVLLSYDTLGRTVDYGLLRLQAASSSKSDFFGAGRKMAVALDTNAYEALSRVNEVEPVEADLVFLVYDLARGPAQDCYVLTRHQTVYAKQNASLAEAEVLNSGFLKGNEEVNFTRWLRSSFGR